MQLPTTTWNQIQFHSWISSLFVIAPLLSARPVLCQIKSSIIVVPRNGENSTTKKKKRKKTKSGKVFRQNSHSLSTLLRTVKELSLGNFDLLLFRNDSQSLTRYFQSVEMSADSALVNGTASPVYLINSTYSIQRKFSVSSVPFVYDGLCNNRFEMTFSRII